ncbi:MAG: serine metalloprotease, partial [Legionella sp.]|nr:serine metalloprotease [Legionella sp.]
FGESTNPYNSCVGDIPCGHGILDAQNAVKATLAHYDVLFSAPKFADMAASPCGNSSSLATDDTLVFKNSSWKKITKGCQNLNDYQHPRIVQNADGTIDAIYGAVRYRLQTSSYKFCEVIGFDGIGCQN